MRKNLTLREFLKTYCIPSNAVISILGESSPIYRDELLVHDVINGRITGLDDKYLDYIVSSVASIATYDYEHCSYLHIMLEAKNEIE